MNAMKQRVLCLAAQPYDMKGEDGRVVQGISLYYITTDELTPNTTDFGGFGVQPVKSTVPYSKVEKLMYFPALYDLTLGMTTKKGVPVIGVKDLDFVSCVELVATKPILVATKPRVESKKFENGENQ
jgi:hypothetical protein